MGSCKGPLVPHKDHAVYFGKVEGEDRGSNPMNPPRVRNDPLFWLRDDERKNEEVLAHLRKEQAYFEERTADTKELADAIYAEHISHIQETDMSAPYPHGDYMYYTRDVAKSSYKIYCRVPAGKTPGKEGDEQILLDVNKLAEGKSFCGVHAVSPSPTHKLVAYAVDYNGSEIYSINFLNDALSTGAGLETVTDTISETTGDIVWDADGLSFFYVTMDEAHRDNKVWRHVIGTKQAEDVCLYTEDDPLFRAHVEKSGDGQTIILGSASSETTEAHLLDLRKGVNHKTLELVRAREKGVRYDVELHGTDTLYILTNKDDCINNKLLKVSRAAMDKWDDVVVAHNPERLMDEIGVYKNFMVLGGRFGGLTRVWTMLVDPATGSFVPSEPWEVTMEEDVFTVSLCLSEVKKYDTPTFRMTYSSMTTPTTWFDVRPDDHVRTTVKVREVGGGFQSENYVCERHFATAPDGTRIPMSMVFRKDLDRSQPQPLLLYGYGSYGICIDPSFSIKQLPYLDRGVIYVIGHIRGGGEMGRAWYEQGGKYLTKRNTFSDFIAVAEYLIEKKYTTPQQLACEGRSAGGLLMGAVLNMRPDLFTAAVAGVPFVDVVTTMCDPSIPLTTGEWEEWGNPNEYKYFDYMLSYSPVDNVRAQAYPALLVQAGLHDPRVAYWEPAKWICKLRETKTDDNEILFKIDLESGHFSASDRYKYWKESAKEQAFVCKHLKSMALKCVKK